MCSSQRTEAGSGLGAEVSGRTGAYRARGAGLCSPALQVASVASLQAFCSDRSLFSNELEGILNDNNLTSSDSSLIHIFFNKKYYVKFLICEVLKILNDMVT